MEYQKTISLFLFLSGEDTCVEHRVCHFDNRLSHGDIVLNAEAVATLTVVEVILDAPAFQCHVELCQEDRANLGQKLGTLLCGWGVTLLCELCLENRSNVSHP